MENGQGKLEEKNEKQTVNGDKFYTLKIGGRSMSAFNDAASSVAKVPIGSFVKYTMDVKMKDGKTYHNLQTIMVADEPDDKLRLVGSEEPVGDGSKRIPGVTIGMAVNNSAAFVTAHFTNLTAQQYAQKVCEYADALLEEMQRLNWTG